MSDVHREARKKALGGVNNLVRQAVEQRIRAKMPQAAPAAQAPDEDDAAMMALMKHLGK